MKKIKKEITVHEHYRQKYNYYHASYDISWIVVMLYWEYCHFHCWMIIMPQVVDILNWWRKHFWWSSDWLSVMYIRYFTFDVKFIYKFVWHPLFSSWKCICIRLNWLLLYNYSKKGYTCGCTVGRIRQITVVWHWFAKCTWKHALKCLFCRSLLKILTNLTSNKK